MDTVPSAMGPFEAVADVELADIADLTLAIPIAPTHEHLTVPRNGLPTVHNPISAVTRDGRHALVRGFSNGRTDLLQVDLGTGA